MSSSYQSTRQSTIGTKLPIFGNFRPMLEECLRMALYKQSKTRIKTKKQNENRWVTQQKPSLLLDAENVAMCHVTMCHVPCGNVKRKYFVIIHIIISFFKRILLLVYYLRNSLFCYVNYSTFCNTFPVLNK